MPASISDVYSDLSLTKPVYQKEDN
ncbi:uncharacterized protein METZ01_LOCUS440075 [marine metagenome]|uniref:Uncharacterized protein n=1 Tax=marine metagenome TaxID=408172 RepID=A0A382YVS6_9ZZZZ